MARFIAHASLLLTLAIVLARWPGSALDSQVIVEDWSRQALGKRGVPSEWRPYEI